MEYLNRVLGIRVVYQDEDLKFMPNYIHARYRIQRVTLNGEAAVFAYPKDELDSIDSVKKHLDRIKRTANAPVVLVLEHLTYRQKEYLLRDRIPFLVDGKQIYLPFMAVYLQERGDSEKKETAEMLPSAQLLLLYFIYQGCRDMMASEAVSNLSFSSTSISRASRQLEGMGLIKTEKRGVQKVILSERTPRELFELAKDVMGSPVKRTIYVSKQEIHKGLLMSSYSALTEYSMMNPPRNVCYASDSISAWEKDATLRMQNSEDQCAVELWRYDPKKLSDGECVDRLSLILALRQDRDERVEEAIEEILEKVWRDIDGKRI